ncbi:Zinc finger BED domain-containing protein RICESLEEPER 1 [Linum perenne]
MSYSAMELSEAVVVKSSRLKSVVWNDFDRVKKGDTFVAICRHCKKKLSGSSTSGTSHLRNHLIRCQRRINHGISSYMTPKEKKTLALANVAMDQDQKMVEPLSIVNYRFDQGQMKDELVTVAAKGNLDQRRSEFDLARMVMLHGYPLGMVEHTGFRVFVRNLQPLFELVTFDKLEADCKEIYAKERQKVYEVLDKLPGKISISADLWTAPDIGEYLCLTGHYVDETWQLKKRILNFIMIDPSHTEDMHSEDIMNCVKEWDIDRKLFSMTVDSYSIADNVMLRIRDQLSQNRFLYCNGHLFEIRCAVNLVSVMAHDALDAVLEITNKIRESIRYVRSSQLIQAKFSDLALQAGIVSERCISLDSLLRWDTTYFMLEATLEYRRAFSLLQEQDPAYSFCPSDLEWGRVATVSSYLKLFLDVINVFTKSKYPTANIYFSEVCDIHLQLIEWIKNPDVVISNVAVKMKNKFDEYWDKCNLPLAVAAMLDPRFKMKLIEYYYPQLFVGGSAEYVDEVFEYIKTLYSEHSIGSPLASLDQGLACQVGSSSGSRDRLTGFDKFLHETSQSQGSKSDLDKYLEEPLFPRTADFNILNWWHVHTPRYPILAMMARNILGAPMSKVAPEHAFGNAGRVVDQDWALQQPATVQALMCSQDWIRNEAERHDY